MNYWLVKSEPSVYSIDDLARDKKTHWHGVRNYQARNFLKAMQQGDLVLFYHSNEQPIGVAGVAKIVATAYPDPSQFDKKSEYFDAKASIEKPRWFCPELGFVEKFSKVITLADLKAHKKLSGLGVLQTGSRLSVQPVSYEHFEIISKM